MAAEQAPTGGVGAVVLLLQIHLDVLHVRERNTHLGMGGGRGHRVHLGMGGQRVHLGREGRGAHMGGGVGVTE